MYVFDCVSIICMLSQINTITGCRADRVEIDDTDVSGDTVTVAFSSEDPNALFRCKLSGQRFRPCKCANKT